MSWSFRPGIDAQKQLEELEKTIGIENLQNVSVILNSGTYYLQIFTQDKKFRVQLTEVS